MSTPRPWWDELGSSRPGPARIRVALNRELTEAEREHLRETGRLIQTYVSGDKFRVSPDDFIYAESNNSTSRQLYSAVAKVVEESFVNVYPVAVRTFRELVTPPYKNGGFPLPGMTTATNTTNTAIEFRTNVAQEPRTEARPSTIATVEAEVRRQVKKLKKKVKG